MALAVPWQVGTAMKKPLPAPCAGSGFFLPAAYTLPASEATPKAVLIYKGHFPLSTERFIFIANRL
jgi:hypothetical protein